jgi:hypothetical protein
MVHIDNDAYSVFLIYTIRQLLHAVYAVCNTCGILIRKYGSKILFEKYWCRNEETIEMHHKVVGYDVEWFQVTQDRAQ